jgi:hypothetical protein
MPTSRDETVDPVSRSERRQEPRGNGSMIGAEQQPEEKRKERQT